MVNKKDKKDDKSNMLLPILNQDLVNILKEWEKRNELSNTIGRQEVYDSKIKDVSGDMRQYFIENNGKRKNSEEPLNYRLKGKGTEKYHQAIEFTNNLIIKHLDRLGIEAYKQNPKYLENYVGKEVYWAVVQKIAGSQNSVEKALEELKKEKNVDFISMLAKKEHFELEELEHIQNYLSGLGEHDEESNKITRSYAQDQIKKDIHDSKKISELLPLLGDHSQNDYKLNDTILSKHYHVLAEKEEREKYKEFIKTSEESGFKKDTELQTDYKKAA